jgi:hypothetical protein
MCNFFAYAKKNCLILIKCIIPINYNTQISKIMTNLQLIHRGKSYWVRLFSLRAPPIFLKIAGKSVHIFFEFYLIFNALPCLLEVYYTLYILQSLSSHFRAL